MPTQTDIDTFHQARADYLADADWFGSQDAAKVGRYVTALQRLILLLPRMSSHGGINPEVAQFDTLQLREELRTARAYLAVLHRCRRPPSILRQTGDWRRTTPPIKT